MLPGDIDPNGDFRQQLMAALQDPEVVNLLHQYSDYDNIPEGLHHSLGLRHDQSSYGDHAHNGKDSSLIFHTFLPENYGAIGDGSNDDAPAINAAINAAKAINGGFVDLSTKTYGIASAIIGAKNVLIRGAGADWRHNTGINTGATNLKALTASMTMISYAPTFTSGNDQAGSGGGVVGVYCDANNNAAVGLEVRSWRNGLFDWLGIAGAFSTCGLYTGTVAQTTGADDKRDVQECVFSRIDINVSGSGDGAILDGDATNLGADGSNTSINTFMNVSINHVNGTGLHMKNADNNTFINVRTFASGTGIGLWMRGATYSGGECRSNTFLRFTSNTSPTVEGTGGSVTQAAHDNVFYAWDQSNGIPAPTIGVGANLHRIDTNGVLTSMSAVGFAIADSLTAVAGLSPNGNLVLFNGSSDHLHLMDSLRTAKIYIDSLGPDIQRISGGSYTSLERGLKVDGTTGLGFYGTNPVSKPTVTGSRGGNAALASLLTGLAGQGLITDSTTP